MLIGPRYNEEHIHADATCVETHRRNINNTVYLFTRVGNKSRTMISVTKMDVIGFRTHLVSGPAKVCKHENLENGKCVDCGYDAQGNCLHDDWETEGEIFCGKCGKDMRTNA